MLISKLSKTRAYVFWLAPGLLVLPLFTFTGSEDAASQKDRWFGWDATAMTCWRTCQLAAW